MKNRKSFEEYVIESILANNGFDIKLVSKIITLQSRYFVQGEYILIEDLIAQKKSELVNEIENIPVDKNEFLYKTAIGIRYRCIPDPFTGTADVEERRDFRV